MTNIERFARREDVSIAAKGLMQVILSFGHNGHCRPTRAQLLQYSTLSTNRLERVLRELRLAGELNMHRTRDPNGHVRTMFIPFPQYPDFTTALPPLRG